MKENRISGFNSYIKPKGHILYSESTGDPVAIYLPMLYAGSENISDEDYITIFTNYANFLIDNMKSHCNFGYCFDMTDLKYDAYYAGYDNSPRIFISTIKGVCPKGLITNTGSLSQNIIFDSLPSLSQLTYLTVTDDFNERLDEPLEIGYYIALKIELE